LISLMINGPTTLTPGASQQYTAIATLSDRSMKDVTSATSWRISDMSVFSMVGGLVTANALGEGFLAASYQNRSAGLAIVSLPAGTGVLVGSVKESGFAVPDARIEVAAGPYAGNSVISDRAGNYRMYGVVGDVQIRATRAGYISQTVQTTVLPLANPRRDQVLNFDLVPVTRVLSLPVVYPPTPPPPPPCASS